MKLRNTQLDVFATPDPVIDELVTPCHCWHGERDVACEGWSDDQDIFPTALGAIAAVAIAVIAVGLPAVSAPAAAASISCNPTMDNPHFSSGGIIAKGRANCNSSSIGKFTPYVILYLCPRDPTGAESTWASQGCVLKYGEPYTITNPTPGVPITRYVPAVGQVGHGTGTWVGCQAWNIYLKGSNTIYSHGTVRSQAVYLSA